METDLALLFRDDAPEDNIQSLTACTQYPRYDKKILYVVCDTANDLSKRRSNYNIKKIKVLACPFCGTSSHDEIAHIENCTFNTDVQFWCATCNAKAFAWCMQSANRNEIESKYPYHPALEEKDVVFCKSEIQYIHGVSISRLIGYRTSRVVDAADVSELIDYLSDKYYHCYEDEEIEECDIKINEIFEKYSIETNCIDNGTPFPCIPVNSYNLEKPATPYPKNMKFHLCGDMTVVVTFAIGRLYYNCRDMSWFSEC